MIVQSIRTAGKNILMLLLLGSLCFGMVTPGKAEAATDEELKNQIAELTRILQILKAQVAGQITSVGSDVAVLQTDWFTEPVVFETDNNSVRLLQEILKTDPAIYPEGLVSGYFGGLTKNALAAFQTKVGLPVTGTFTDEVEYVLNYTLSAVSLKSYPATYLVNEKVRSYVQAGVQSLAIRDVVDNGAVVLSTNPVFSETIPTPDTATIQRILITDGMYRGLKVNGLMDAITIQSLSEFLRKYGVPFTISDNGVLHADSLMTKDVVALFRKILEINASSVINSKLLTLPEVQPDKLIPISSRTISSIKAVRDYRLDDTKVIIVYEGGLREDFVLPGASSNDEVAVAIAKKLDRPLGEVKPTITHSSVNGKDFKRIELVVFADDAMDLLIEYKDSKTEKRTISAVDIAFFVAYTYGGNYVAYEQDFDYYVEKARNGEPIDKVYSLVADVVGTTKAKVKEVLVIDVQQYQRDPCYRGNDYICGGA